jgi:S-adenosylmethionine hydrolase
MTKIHKRIIALITDFGHRGLHYAASMKGIILGINPEVNIIDISHNISPFSVLEAAYILKSVYSYFPENTIFIIVVDPDVGSLREVLIIKINSNQYIISPNNGIIPLAFSLDKIVECINIQNSKYFHNPISQTFHGRDIMAPVAAFVSNGVSLKEFGTKFNISGIVNVDNHLNINHKDKIIECTIQYIDTFGNCTTNLALKNHKIQNSSIELKDGMALTLNYKSKIYEGIYVSYFKAVPKNQLIYIKGSTEFLEISINQGNAASLIGFKVGDLISIKF